MSGGDHPAVSIRPARADDRELHALLVAYGEALIERRPSEARLMYVARPEPVQHFQFLVAVVDDVSVACGAIDRLDGMIDRRVPILGCRLKRRFGRRRW